MSAKIMAVTASYAASTSGAISHPSYEKDEKLLGASVDNGEEPCLGAWPARLCLWGTLGG